MRGGEGSDKMFQAAGETEVAAAAAADDDDDDPDDTA